MSDFKKQAILTDEIFFQMVASEVTAARQKFPEPNATFAALVEEVGEVGTALMYERWGNVVREAVQVAAMALRLAVEGDASMRSFRYEHVHENGLLYTRPKDRMP